MRLLSPNNVVQGSHIARRAIVMQKKTQRPVQFEITEQTRHAVAAWIAAVHLKPEQFLFPSRVSASPHLSTRQYSRIVRSWGQFDRFGRSGIRDAFDATYESYDDLSADQKS